jgi:hypothetical protein
MYSKREKRKRKKVSSFGSYLYGIRQAFQNLDLHKLAGQISLDRTVSDPKITWCS